MQVPRTVSPAFNHGLPCFRVYPALEGPSTDGNSGQGGAAQLVAAMAVILRVANDLRRIIHTVILSAAKDLGGVSETGQILRCAQNDRRTALFMNNPG